MVVIGFHASHEQVHPAHLLEAVQAAEQAGFTAAMCSDHFAPWGERQGHSGFAWAWLGAALQATTLPLGVVTAPGQRYHPAVIAQAIATLAAMYPGRFWSALGSGEAVNEHITGDGWPRKDVRETRLGECVDVMRRLLAGEEVTHDGLVTVDRARLWTRPPVAPPLLGAAISTATARWVARWADGLITVHAPSTQLATMIEAYREAGGRGPVAVQVHLSFARDDGTALQIAHDQWRTNVFPGPLCWDIDTPRSFDQAAAHVPQEALRDTVLVSADPKRHAGWLQDYASLGVDEIYLHHVGQEQREFIDTFGARVLPELDVTTRST
jgi:probable non-F420 flavinoid oxidoreductase